jgi:hypothetical protein
MDPEITYYGGELESIYIEPIHLETPKKTTRKETFLLEPVQSTGRLNPSNAKNRVQIAAAEQFSKNYSSESIFLPLDILHLSSHLTNPTLLHTVLKVSKARQIAILKELEIMEHHKRLVKYWNHLKSEFHHLLLKLKHVN